MTRVHEPETIGEAVDLLTSLGGDAGVLAGGTWIMRAGLRGEVQAGDYVSLRRIGSLHGTSAADGDVRLGALATHVDIGVLHAGAGPLGALTEAARRSAFPAVRNVATLGGNLSAPFPEADLVPPLLAAEARLEVARPGRTDEVDVATWLRADRPPGSVVVAARVPVRGGRRSWFERLTVRGGAEYSLASVAVSVDLGDDGTVKAARVAVGAVEAVPKQVPAAESALAGRRLEPAAAQEAGTAAAETLRGRDELGVPGWYRVTVLPALLRRAVERLAS